MDTIAHLPTMPALTYKVTPPVRGNEEKARGELLLPVNCVTSIS